MRTSLSHRNDTEIQTEEIRKSFSTLNGTETIKMQDYNKNILDHTHCTKTQTAGI